MSTPITKENSVNVLINSVRLAQKNGAFLLRESALLADAIDYFNPDVKEKPTFDGSKDPEVTAVNLLFQGVQKGQAHAGEFSYSMEDARLLWKIMEFWVKEGGKAVTQNVDTGASSSKDKKSAKSAANSVRQSDPADEEDEDEDEDEGVTSIRPLQTVKSGKGKERA